MLSILAGAGRFAAFAMNLEVKGLRTAQPANLIGLAPSPRVNLFFLSLVAFRSFLVRNFGESFLSRAKFVRVAAVSAFIVLGLFLTSHAVSDTAWRAPADGTMVHLSILTSLGSIALCLMVLIFLNTVFDTLAIAIVRHLVEPCKSARMGPVERRQLAKRAAFLPAYALAIYVLFVTTMNAAFSIIITIRALAAGYPFADGISGFVAVQVEIFRNETLLRFTNPIETGAAIRVGETNLLLFCVMPLIPLALLSTTAVIGLMLETVDRLSQGRVTATLVSRDRKDNRTILTAAVVLSILGAGAALLVSR